MHIVQVINQDLGMDAIQLPERSVKAGANAKNVEQVRVDADRSREVITKLLAERNAAEQEINIKADELEKIQRFLKESEVCMGLIESELHETQQELKNLKNANEHDPAEMQNLIQRFALESSEMLACIETLEKENLSLKSQLDTS